MKKIYLVMAVAAVCTLTSCKKDYVCSCTTSSNAPGSTTDTHEYTIVGAKKGDAKKMCIKTTNDNTYGGVTYTSTSDCKLK
jgi:hypothetical protein